MRVTVEVVRRPEISDPQGVTVGRALHDLGYGSVRAVRIDRVIRLDMAEEDPERAREQVAEMCERLLANPILEDYRVMVEP